MADASIRLRLDAKDAQRSLAELRSDFQRTADAAGQIGGSFDTGGGGGGGGIGLGRIAAIGSIGLGAFALGRGTFGGIRDLGAAASEGPSEILADLLLGDSARNARGSLSALSQVRQQAGLAVGFGASPESFRGLFNALENIAQREERGKAELARTFGGGIAAEAGSDVVTAIRELPGRIGEVWARIFGGG